MSCVVFAGGGTGGHLLPGIAVADGLAQSDRGIRLVFLGTGKAVEKTVVGATSYEYRQVPMSVGRRLLGAAAARVFSLPLAVGSARRLLKQMHADVVVGLGGYGMVAAAIAARSLGLPLVALEQNVIPGRAVKIVGYFARQILASFDETARYLPYPRKLCAVGNPVRKGLGVLDKAEAAGRLGLQAGFPTLLVLGGSQGATAINDVVVSLVERLAQSVKGLQVIHQCGAQDFERIRAFYEEKKPVASFSVKAFYTDMAAVYSMADFAVARAGATTLAELAAVGLGALLIPYPHATADHQWANALYYARRGGAKVMRQSEATSEKVLDALKEVFGNPELRGEMSKVMRSLGRPEAAQAVAEKVLKFVR